MVKPGFEAAMRAPVRRACDLIADNHTKAGWGNSLDINIIGANITDMREGEIDDLPGIGRVCHDFLVACHRGVKADFADICGLCPKSRAGKNLAILKNKNGRWLKRYYCFFDRFIVKKVALCHACQNLDVKKSTNTVIFRSLPSAFPSTLGRSGQNLRKIAI